ncbi:MAG: hypothetical protein ACXWC1_33685, partial [Burkholderiales bacterium]
VVPALYEPNDGGEFSFRPHLPFKTSPKIFLRNFESIKLDRVSPPLSVRTPAQVRSADCWEATATASFRDFSVVVEDSSNAGTYALKALISKIQGFARCEWGK